MDLKTGKNKPKGQTFLAPSNIVLPAAIGKEFSISISEETFPNILF